jgi:hypothetical protein
VAALVLLAAVGCTAGGTPAAIPATSPAMLPSGALNPAVSQATVDTTVCVPRWTASIRPSLPTRPGYQYDHVIPLGLGGSPADAANLAYVPTEVARRQDVLETLLHRLVCAHKMTLADAQRLVLAIKRGA